jgi:hypothetical protein
MFSNQENQLKLQNPYEKSRLTPDLYFQVQLESEISRNDIEDVKTLVRVLRKNSTFLVNKTLRKLLNLDSTLKKREVIRNHIFRLTGQAFNFLDKYHFWLIRFNELSTRKLAELKSIEEQKKKISQKFEMPVFQMPTNESNKSKPMEIDIYQKNYHKPANTGRSKVHFEVKKVKEKPLGPLFDIDIDGRCWSF